MVGYTRSDRPTTALLDWRSISAMTRVTYHWPTTQIESRTSWGKHRWRQALWILFAKELEGPKSLVLFTLANTSNLRTNPLHLGSILKRNHSFHFDLSLNMLKSVLDKYINISQYFQGSASFRESTRIEIVRPDWALLDCTFRLANRKRGHQIFYLDFSSPWQIHVKLIKVWG